ncbi:MAG: GTPase HflX [Candidatus Hodarchaeota archaeon]
MEVSDKLDSHQVQECFLILPLATDKRQFLLNEEMRELLSSAHYHIIKEYILNEGKNPNYLFSIYQLNEIQHEIDSETSLIKIVIGAHLSPNQGVNLEELFGSQIIDKFDLVLEIFEARAMTEESKLQIELAQIKYEHPRKRLRLMHQLGIEGAWHTERSGFWGTGENPLNVFDASMTKREAFLKKNLSNLKTQREKRRESRKRRHFDSLYVSIVGYTSAGKSTLLNSLTKSNASSVNSRLFETLDTRIRSFQLEDLKIFITDTIGFIEDLPTFLIDSFKSTLEESLAADIILIIVDLSEPIESILQKSKISTQIIADLNPQNYRVLVLNKTDLVSSEVHDKALRIIKKEFSDLKVISVSAINNLSPLITELNNFRPKKRFKCHYSPNHKFRAFCYDFTQVEHESFENSDWEMIISLRKPEYGVEVLKQRALTLGVQLNLETI